MTNTELVITLLSSSTGTVCITEAIKAVRRRMQAKRGRGFSKLESDIREIRTDIKGIREDLDESKEAERVLLHDRLWQLFHFFQDKDEISVEDRANVEYLWDEYKKKQGNHEAEVYYEYIESLNVIPKAKKESEANEG